MRCLPWNTHLFLVGLCGCSSLFVIELPTAWINKVSSSDDLWLVEKNSTQISKHEFPFSNLRIVLLNGQKWAFCLLCEGVYTLLHFSFHWVDDLADFLDYVNLTFSLATQAEMLRIYFLNIILLLSVNDVKILNYV